MTKNMNYIQLRAARNILDLGVRDIAKLIKVSKATISKAELGKTRDFFFKHSAALIDFFEKNGIIFPNEYSIRYNYFETIPGNTDVLTRFQVKCARGILNISQLKLSTLIGVNKGIISRIELTENHNFINPTNIEVSLRLKNLFLHHNIEFPDSLSTFFKKYVDK